MAQLKAKIVHLEKKLEECATAYNETKNQNFVLKNDSIQKGNHVLLLQEENAKLQEHIRQEKVVSDGLRSLNDLLDAKMNSRGGGLNVHSFFKRLEKSIDKRYLSLASTVERKLSKRLPSETMEIEYSQDEKKIRKWDCRMEVVTEYGIEVRNPSSGGTQLVVPTCFRIVMLSKDSFYVSSFPSHEIVLRSAVLETLESPEGVNFRATEDVKMEAASIISGNSVMLAKMKHFSCYS